ncbi:MAG TPA: hypothetical protein EYG86_01230 [Crocinitomicaceae bacterium]|nr:hypothetical protein [Crocinitomicaceae bacterium]
MNKINLIVFVVLIFELPSCLSSNKNLLGKYVARENSDHVIELKSTRQYSGVYFYYINNKVVNQGTWEFYDGAFEKICFNDWKSQGLYQNDIDSTPSSYTTQISGSKLEFHPDLNEDDFIKE